MIQPRQRTCKLKQPGCHGKYTPFNTLQACCPNPKCAIEAGRLTEAKKNRQALRDFRKRNKPRSKWLKEAQAAFNKWVRLRDQGKPCISCGSLPEQKYGGTMDAGHYRSVGACPALRFEEFNCHAQCVRCNQHLSGNTVEYRIRLVKRIGQQRVDWLEGEHEPKKYSIEELKAIKAHYAEQARVLQKAG
ncbi:recombination protein NinG [Pontibacter sp. JAM-7]|uniref:recombination protein NinG n=1 Tax=Pontibacter sp. JAM-7 TaxID=3366581 RepID=UPI003AF5CF91